MQSCHKCKIARYDKRGAIQLIAAQYDMRGKFVRGTCEHGTPISAQEPTEHDRSVAAIPLALLSIGITV